MWPISTLSNQKVLQDIRKSFERVHGEAKPIESPLPHHDISLPPPHLYRDIHTLLWAVAWISNRHQCVLEVKHLIFLYFFSTYYLHTLWEQFWDLTTLLDLLAIWICIRLFLFCWVSLGYSNVWFLWNNSDSFKKACFNKQVGSILSQKLNKQVSM